MLRKVYLLAILTAVGLFLIGCSGGGNNITAPGDVQTTTKESNMVSSHYLWGYWQGIIDPEAETIEFIRLREGNFHLNVIVFLEPPALANLTLEYLEFDGDLITADIGLKHPFLGMTEFTGFDVCGILITNGSVSGFSDPDIVMAGSTDMRLLNPDGLSRWWNPAEFPINDGTMFGYVDGLLGAPDSYADYNSTLNGYKYFCDDLNDPESSLEDVTITGRGMFSAGQKNIRRYEIELGDIGLIFNYAVDASWEFPVGDYPWKAPGDFPPEANRVEAWRISVAELENTLWNDGADSGGDLSLAFDVYDWYNADLNTVRVESPSNFTMAESTTIIGGGEGYSTYQVDITGATPAAGSIDLLISIISEQEDWQDFIPGGNTTSYFPWFAPVGSEPPVSLSIQWLDLVELTGPWTDEISPCIAQETDNELKAFWFGYRPPSNADDIGAYSHNGFSWIGKTNTFGTGGGGIFYRVDHCKIAPHQNGSSHTLIDVFKGSPYYLTLTDTDRMLKGSYPYRFNWIPNGYSNNIEVMTDNSGYIFGVADRYGNLNANKTSAPNSASGSNPFIIDSGNNARLSHVRSWDCDGGNIMWLAYGKTSLDGIYLAYGNDSTNMIWTAGFTVYEDSNYNDIRDPSMHLVDDVIHLSFLRHDTTSGDYELCYTYGDITSGFSDPVVIDSSSSPIEDPHLQFGNYISYDILGAAYMKETVIWFSFSYDSGETWQPPEAVQTIDTPAEDPDMIFINHAGGLTEDFIVIWVQGGGANNDCFTRMGHFVEN